MRHLIVGSALAALVFLCVACGGGPGLIDNPDAQARREANRKAREAADKKPAPSGEQDKQAAPSKPVVRRPAYQDSPFYTQAKQWISSGSPEISALQMGAFGGMPPLEIFQILGSDQALGRILETDEIVMLNGFSMSGRVDGQNVAGGLSYVSGTTSYQNVLGGSRTIFVLSAVAVDTEAIRSEIGAEMEERARIEAERERIAEEARREAEQRRLAELRESQFRTWETDDLKFSVEARLARFTGGKVTLERRDGTTVDVAEDILSDADRQYIQAEYKRRAKASRKAAADDSNSPIQGRTLGDL